MIPSNIGCEVGPRGMPFLGYAPFFINKGAIIIQSAMQKMALKTYGLVTGSDLGPVLALISVDCRRTKG